MMPSEKLQKVSYEFSEVSKFYEGKSVFITGANGFLGQVLLEILLRLCPGIIRIYILLRPKTGLKPQERGALIFKTELFHKLRENYPDALNKVVTVPGDVSQENLGMCEKDFFRVTEEVSVVFHCAADLSFFKPLSFLMAQNVIGTDNIIELCKKMAKLEALVYTSSLSSNANRIKVIKEIVHKLPFNAEQAVRLTRYGDMDGLSKLFSMCNPNFPNFYTFSKCVAENLLAEKGHNLPVSIIRPSLIINCMKGALPGYTVAGTVFIHIGLGIGYGITRVLRLHDKVILEFVPADVAANTHILAAFLQATKGLPSPSVYNCTSGTVTPHTWKDFFLSFKDLVLKYPLPNCYRIPSLIICKNLLLYKFYVCIYHFIPAMIIDMFLWIAGKEFRLTRLYKFQERMRSAVNIFLKKRVENTCENFVSLSKNLNETDAEIYYVDMRDFNLKKWISCFPSGCPQYRVNNKPYKDTFRAYILRYFLTYLIMCFQIGIIVAVGYFVCFLSQKLSYK